MATVTATMVMASTARVPEKGRRSRQRFPIELRVRFRMRAASRRKQDEYQTGRSVDIASKGIHISGPRPPLRSWVYMLIDWPAKLSNSVGLQLEASGPVMRHTETGFVITFDTHQFRTCRVV